MNISVRTNLELDDLFCVSCKRRINIGEKYAMKKETYGTEKIKLYYHLDCLPEDEE